MTSEFPIALHALIHLNIRATTVSSAALSDVVCTNPTRVRKIMAKLKKANLVITKEGTDGGYFFHQDASAVTLKQIVDAVQAPIVTSNWYSSSTFLSCPSAVAMNNILTSICTHLDACCKKKLMNITLWDIQQQFVGAIQSPNP
jgi:Rrf2 family protein